MYKSKYPRWFNPTEDGLWDSYYETIWTFWGGFAAIILIVSIASFAVRALL